MVGEIVYEKPHIFQLRELNAGWMNKLTDGVKSFVKELSKRNGVEYADIECEDGIAKTIVIHGWKE